MFSRIARQSTSLFKQPLVQPYRMSSSITTIISSNAPPAAGPYSHAVKYNGIVYVSGQIPYTTENKPIGGDIQAQTEQVFKNLQGVLADANSSLDRVLKVNIFLADMGDFKSVNEVYVKYFSTHKPARSCVAAKALPLGVEIELECIAAENE